MRSLACLALLGVIGFATTLVSCATDVWGPDELLRGASSKEAATLKRGREQYSLYCAGCHGESGDGAGQAARFLNPKPRDFRKGRVKFAAVPAGTLPRDEDLLTAPPGARKLGGAGMHHFGAFFDRGARERDYLWGRVDGASRLVRILVGDDDALRRELTATVVDAILEEDAGTLPLASELVAHLRSQLPALRAG